MIFNLYKYHTRSYSFDVFNLYRVLQNLSVSVGSQLRLESLAIPIKGAINFTPLLNIDFLSSGFVSSSCIISTESFIVVVSSGNRPDRFPYQKFYTNVKVLKYKLF